LWTSRARPTKRRNSFDEAQISRIFVYVIDVDQRNRGLRRRVREWWSKAGDCALATVNGMIRPCSGAVALRQKWSRGQIEARLAKMPPLPPCIFVATKTQY
jgi:hypothetical protein